jgi:putative peptidoglycan lipid II flippase
MANLFHREFGGLNQAAMILAFSSLLSGFLGLFRDRLLAGIFGAGQTLDIYYASFKIPDFLYILSLAIGSVTVLIPFFLEKMAVSLERGRDFFDNIFSVFLLIMLVLITVVFFLVPLFSDIVAPGFSPEAKNQFIVLTRILLLSPLILGLSNLVSSVIQSFNRFFVYALSPLLYNAGIILGIVFLLPRFGLRGLVAGVILGAVLHLCIQLPTLFRLNCLPRLKIKFDPREAWKVIKFSFPRTLGLSLHQLVLIFITAVASLFNAGSIAVFNLSFSLQSIPLAVIGVSYSVAAFPTLAKLFVNGQRDKFLEQTVLAMRQIVFWSIPASILMIVLRAQIVRVIYGYGKFDWRDTRLTAAAAGIFAVSIIAQSLVILFARAFYAAGKTTRPVVVNVISSVLTVGGVFLLLSLIRGSSSGSLLNTILRTKDVPGSEMLILPIVYSLGMFINAFILVKIFENDFGSIWFRVKRGFLQVVFASLLMGGTVYLALNIFDKIFNIRTFIGIFLQGAVSAILGITVWFFVLRVFKNKELDNIINVLRQKFWKTPAIAPEPEELP